MEPFLVMVTTPTEEEAHALASALLEAKLAACVSVIPGIVSHFVWQGARERASECLLLVKTLRGLFARVVETVRAHHSYQVPEILGIPIAAGDQAYLEWVASSVAEART